MKYKSLLLTLVFVVVFFIVFAILLKMKSSVRENIKPGGIEQNILPGETLLGAGNEGKAFLSADGTTVRKGYYHECGYVANMIALEELSGEPHIPRLIGHDPDKLEVYMEYCGKPVTKKNLPEDAKQQLADLNRTLKKHRIYNADASRSNFCVKNGTLYLIDWGNAIPDKSKNINVGLLMEKYKKS